MFNIFAVGLTGTLHSRYLAGQNGQTLTRDRPPGDRIDSLDRRDPLEAEPHALSGDPMAFGVRYLLNHTWYGLYARSAGERPMAAESGGLHVVRLRYPAVIVGSVFAALGGSALVLSTSGGFVPGMTAGRGFIAMGVVVLAKWRPLWILIYRLRFRPDPGPPVPGRASDRARLGAQAVLGRLALSDHRAGGGLCSRLDISGCGGDPLPEGRFLIPGPLCGFRRDRI